MRTALLSVSLSSLVALVAACDSSIPGAGLDADVIADSSVGGGDAGEQRLDASGSDAGQPDASAADAGQPDASPPDAGEADAGEADAGEADAGEADAGEADAGEADAGEPDAGPAPAAVAPLYPGVGDSFFAWINNDGSGPLDASGTTCATTSALSARDTCLHAGIMRAIELPGFSSCSGVDISDSQDALEWMCDESGSVVRAVSLRFRDDKQLSDLLDFGAMPAWRALTVSASDGVTSFTSEPAEWWANPIVVDNDGGALTSAGTLYVVSQDTTADYTMNLSGAGFLVAPGVTLTGAGSTAGALRTDGAFVYIEGTFVAVSSRAVASVRNHFGILRNITLTDGGLYSIQIENGGSLDIRRVTVTGNAFGFGVYARAAYARLNGINVSNTADEGLFIDGDGLRIADVVAVNSALSVGPPGASGCHEDIVLRNVDLTGAALRFDRVCAGRVLHVTVRDVAEEPISAESSPGTVFYDVRMYNVGHQNAGGARTGRRTIWVGGILHQTPNTGMYFDGGNVVIGMTISNVYQRAYDFGGHNTVMSALSHVAGHADPNPSQRDGFYIGQTRNHLFNSAATLDVGEAIYLGPAGTNTQLSGILRIDSLAGECAVYGELVSPPIDSNCAAGAGSSVAIETGVSSGGLLGAPDFALAASGSPLLARLAVPGGNDVITHNFHDLAPSTCARIGATHQGGTTCAIVFLDRAFERFDDGVGNDNGLCESNEDCVFTPNIGAYQGEGALVLESTIGTGATLENINLYRYATNGR